jgi:hypothetical protein
VITRWNLRTPGRDDTPEATEGSLDTDTEQLIAEKSAGESRTHG